MFMSALKAQIPLASRPTLDMINGASSTSSPAFEMLKPSVDLPLPYRCRREQREFLPGSFCGANSLKRVIEVDTVVWISAAIARPVFVQLPLLEPLLQVSKLPLDGTPSAGVSECLSCNLQARSCHL